jgi:hypothetical protein
MAAVAKAERGRDNEDALEGFRKPIRPADLDLGMAAVEAKVQGEQVQAQAGSGVHIDTLTIDAARQGALP